MTSPIPATLATVTPTSPHTAWSTPNPLVVPPPDSAPRVPNVGQIGPPQRSSQEPNP
jgi:hypothetical protein